STDAPAMPSKRIARLNEQLKREIAVLLRGEVRDPRVGAVSVTAVEVSADLAVARVYVRVVGTDAEREETLAGLEAAAPFLRRTLGRGLHVRRVPELRFQQDRSLEHARRIERILSEVLPDGGDGADDGDGDPAAGESGDGEEDPTR
ncbi:MAG TPA: 30S ribosome-binding factor RbfA, partial [Longimicrobiales bacterium]|nr:30S ribosome-binding factor RbfA [Longimicrobiales bacterium]